jgi:hypothetical protein
MSAEVKFKPFQRVLVRCTENQAWSAAFFSHEQHSEDGLGYVCNGMSWDYCLPYEGNEHLLGTTDDPMQPEPEFKFGDKVNVRDSIHARWYRAAFLKNLDDKDFRYLVILEEAIQDGRNQCTRWQFCRHADW